MKKKLILLILDGFGIGTDNEFNSFERSNARFIKNFLKTNETSLLKTHGSSVGLPENQMGNSEVGHITIGSGRVVFGDLTKINHAIENGEFKKKIIDYLKNHNNSKRIHICGLLSSGGVHSHQNHFFEAIQIFLENKAEVFAHIMLDGRDCSTDQSIFSLKELLEKFGSNPNFQISSLIGRSFGMDRDRRFEKTKIAFDLISSGSDFKNFNIYENFHEFESDEQLIELINKFHSNNISDEYIPPIALKKYTGAQKDDLIFFVNWRADRMRQIVSSLCGPNFNEFERKSHPDKYFKKCFSMGEYSSEISNFCKPIFVKDDLDQTLGDVLEQNHLSQLRIAETEKYAHVTFFFDGGKNKNHKNKSQILVDSPKNVKTYDQKPEMSAKEVKEKIIENIGNFDVIIANFANPDMIGHTGNFDACVKTFEILDEIAKEIDSKLMQRSSDFEDEEWSLILTSDHGNAEEMFDFELNSIKTCHSKNPVPFSLKQYKKSNENHFSLHKTGQLCDIAPTILQLLSLPIPKEFSGKSLLKELYNKKI